MAYLNMDVPWQERMMPREERVNKPGKKKVIFAYISLALCCTLAFVFCLTMEQRMMAISSQVEDTNKAVRWVMDKVDRIADQSNSTHATLVDIHTATEQLEGKPVNNDDLLELPSQAFIQKDAVHYVVLATMQMYHMTDLLKTFLYMEQNSNMRKAVLHIISGGGVAWTALGGPDIVQAAMDRGWYVETRASGIVASAAVPLFTVANKRVATRNTLFMVHDVQGSAPENLVTLMVERYINHMVAYSNLPRAQWEDMMSLPENGSTWFTVKQAKEYGIVDEVI